jgi:DNA-binding NarL/FixJ family response regulator
MYKQARHADKAFDIVILDLTIRGCLGGTETIKKLKKEIDDNVRSVVSSNYSDENIGTGRQNPEPRCNVFVYQKSPRATIQQSGQTYCWYHGLYDPFYE